MHNFVYLAQRRSQKFSCERNFGGGRASRSPWLRHWFATRWRRNNITQPVSAILVAVYTATLTSGFNLQHGVSY